MRKVVRSLPAIALVVGFLFFVSRPVRAQEAPQWKLRTAYHFQDISFAANAHGANLLASYVKPKEWGIRGGFNYVNKFGDSAPGGTLGGTYWPTKTTVLSLDADLAPGQMVVPRQAYTFEISQTLFKVLVPSLGYRFVDYATTNAHIVMPSVTWYFYPRFDWMARYFLSVNQLQTENTLNHSVMTRINWNLVDPLKIFAGYARSNESFELGNNSALPVGGFSADHFFTGWSWEIYKGIGLDFSFDYENRNNSSTLKTYEVGTFYRW